MELKVILNQSIKLEQRLNQTIDIANFLNVPDEVVSVVANAISHNPDIVEKVLQERKQNSKNQDVSGKVRTLYSSISDPKNQESRHGEGIILSPDLRTIQGSLGNYNLMITPDVTYVGKRNEKPEIIFSDHLRGSLGLHLLQLDHGLYPETARLLFHLKRYDQWKRGKLVEAYVAFGDSQREFFENFNPLKHSLFVQDDLAKKINLSGSTVSRILNNRLVEARNLSSEQRIMYAKDLFFTKSDLIRYNALPDLNQVFLEEFKMKKAFSDEEISMRVNKLARRTITKYRKEANIPGARERKELYQSGIVDNPYSLT